MLSVWVVLPVQLSDFKMGTRHQNSLTSAFLASEALSHCFLLFPSLALGLPKGWGWPNGANSTAGPRRVADPAPGEGGGQACSLVQPGTLCGLLPPPLPKPRPLRSPLLPAFQIYLGPCRPPSSSPALSQQQRYCCSSQSQKSSECQIRQGFYRCLFR